MVLSSLFNKIMGKKTRQNKRITIDDPMQLPRTNIKQLSNPPENIMPRKSISVSQQSPISANLIVEQQN